MIQRALVIGLLGIGLAAFSVNKAYPGSTSCWSTLRGGCSISTWPSSVACEIRSTGVHDGYSLVCTTTGNDEWIVVCQNRGGNEPEGLFRAICSADASGEIILDASDISRNGQAIGIAVAHLSEGSLDALADCACPNSNYTASDAIPVSMTAILYTRDEDGCIVSDALYDCTLPNPDTLGYDFDTHEFEIRQYECTETVRHNYGNHPIYPDGTSCP